MFNKNSFFSLALGSIVLFASVMPVDGAKPSRVTSSKEQNNAPVSNVVEQPGTEQPRVEDTSVVTRSKKRKLTWKQKLRKKIRKMKDDVAEFIGDHPVATVASVVGGIIGIWLLWDKLYNPWTRLPNAVGASACDVQQAIIPQGGRELNFGPHLPQVNFHMNQPAHVVQLRCAEQVGPECAYHAIKNGISIVNELVDPRGDLQTWLEDDAVFARQAFGFNRNGNHGVWRQRILNERNLRHIPAGECDQFGDWLRGDAVQNIIDFEIQGRRLLAENIVVNDNNNPNSVHITVIEDANMIGNPVMDPTQAARNNLQARAGAYIHLFIFNTARAGVDAHGMPFVPRRGGHWLPAVFHRDAQGNRRWYVTNSSHQRLIFDAPAFRDLVAAIQGGRVDIF